MVANTSPIPNYGTGEGVMI